jgi:hypothetical protein
MYGADKQTMTYDPNGGMRGAGVVLGMENAKRVPELPHEMDRLERAIAALQDTAGELQSRLDALTRPPEPMPTTANQIGPVGPSTGVGMRLHGFTERIDDVTSRLQSLLRRLEV